MGGRSDRVAFTFVLLLVKTSTPLKLYILQTVAPALDADIVSESLTEWLPADTLDRFHSYGVSFRPYLTELVEYLPDATLSEWIKNLFTVEADPLDLPPAPAPLAC